MAFQIQFSLPVQIPVPVDVKPRETHALIQCIMDNRLEKLKKIVKGVNINGPYSSAIWNDDVSLLTAAAACGNEEICNFLLRENVDPNILSTNGLTSLHYAAKTTGVPLNIVRRLLAAKANPDGHPEQPFTPIQYAACNNRLDMFQVLIEAGADPERSYGLNPDFDNNVQTLLNKLPAGNATVEKCKMFFNFTAMVPKKSQPQVFNFCREHFLEEHPFSHLLLFERYYNVIGTLQEQYRQSSIKWMRDSKKSDIYIKGFIERLFKIPNAQRIYALCSLHAVICMMKEMSPQIFNGLVPILTKCLLPTNTVQDLFNNPTLNILSTLCVAMDKFSKQKPTAEGLNSVVLEGLCKALIPFTNSAHSINISILTYRLFAALYEFVPEHIKSHGLTSVPDRVLLEADIGTDDVLKEKLQKLDINLRCPQSSVTGSSLDDAGASKSSTTSRKKKKKKKKHSQQETSSKEDAVQTSKPDSDTAKTSVEESDSTVHPFTAHTDDLPGLRKWHSISKRWKPKLKTLASMEANQVYHLGNLTIKESTEFEIAKGSDGTRVFLGLRDDGTEVAVKRMLKSNYQDLKNEEQFLRLPALDSPSIVRYVDFAEDDKFGYLVLQLCEYTLAEYIEEHLPEDSHQQLHVLKKIVKEVLCSLKVLHGQETKVLHRDIKPQNVLIDIKGKARLSDFGISRRLKLGETTCRTNAAGTKCWKPRETVDEESNRGYKRSSDIQVAGMLVYYILSCGHHPFGKGLRCEINIYEGKYTLEHLEDEMARDLVEWMISYEPKDRPNVEETLCHPFFWTDSWKVEYLKRLGNINDVDNCRNADPELLSAIEAVTKEKSFSDWKTKLPSELVQKLDGKKKSYPENTLGLLRFIRNLHEHYAEDAEKLNLMTIFPDLFGSAFNFAKKRGWNTKPSLRKCLRTVPTIYEEMTE